MEAVDLLLRRRRRGRLAGRLEALRLPGEELLAESLRVDPERLADVVEAEGPFVVDGLDPLLGLLREKRGLLRGFVRCSWKQRMPSSRTASISAFSPER
jgi:hypothetical protein